MKQLTPVEFLAVPSGALFVDRSPQTTGFGIKRQTVGDSFTFDSFRDDPQKAGSQLKLVTGLTEPAPQKEYLVLLPHEEILVKYKLFRDASKLTRQQYEDLAFRAVQTFTASENIDIELPDGTRIPLNS
jgi:hypothetical protein